MNKDEYLSYLDRIKDLFIEDVNFNHYLQNLNSGKSSFQINQKYLRKVFDHDWIDIIEEILPSLDAIVRNPRRFITVEEDIIDISLAKQISVESVKHLAQHTQFISSANPKTGTVTPSKILNTSKEESYEVYENRFIFTLLKKLQEFISKRYEAINFDRLCDIISFISGRSRTNKQLSVIRPQFFAIISVYTGCRC
jgi:predicted component of viral defense system (DUF524 family)